MTDFGYVYNPRDSCSLRFKDGRKSIITIVKTSRGNFISRQIVRRTFGSVNTFKGWDIQFAFALGLGPTNEEKMIEGLLDREIQEYGDIIMGNFIDTYRNLTYKHLMGYKWAIEFCPQANYLMMTDDDVIIDVFQAVEFLSKGGMQKDYYCYIFSGTNPVRDKGSKWGVTRDEYAAENFQDYCGFGGYIVGTGTLKKIMAVSMKEKYLFIDDVFVTGMLRERANRNEIDPRNKINIIISKGLGYSETKEFEDAVTKKELLTVVEESRSPVKSCWIWNLFLDTRQLSNTYVSTCNCLL